MQRTQISLGDDERALLDAESARSGRSMSALIRDAVVRVYGADRDLEHDLQVIQRASGAWTDRSFDGEEYVDALRSGRRLIER